jgi:hypothetical protein
LAQLKRKSSAYDECDETIGEREREATQKVVHGQFCSNLEVAQLNGILCYFGGRVLFGLSRSEASRRITVFRRRNSLCLIVTFVCFKLAKSDHLLGCKEIECHFRFFACFLSISLFYPKLNVFVEFGE